MIQLIIDGRVTSYACVALMGEIGRIVKIDPVYFRQFVDDLDSWLSYVPMKNLDHDQKMLNRIGNDWYLIAIARSIHANYIITYDKELISMREELGNRDDVEVLTSEEFIEKYKK